MKKLNLYLCVVAGLLLLPVEASAQNVQVGAEQNRGVTSAAAVATDSTGKLKAATIAGAGAGLTTGPTSSVSGDCVAFTGTAGQIADNGAACATTYTLPTATSSTLGGVKPDGTTLTNSSGAISCTTATTSQSGCIKPDGSTITISSGIISAAGSSSQSTILTAATTITSTSLVTTGLALPSVAASTVKRGECWISFHQATASANVGFGIGASAAPTDLWVGPVQFTDTAYPAGYFGSSFTTITSTSTTSLIASIAVTTGTEYVVYFFFTLSTGANPVTVTIYGDTSNASDALVVDPSSSCGWLP